jgi:tetratricopeptide (TPR) repeat protein
MYTEALESLKKADEYLEDPIIYDHMGDVYLKMNEAENARNYWEMSLKLSPEQAHILEKLNALLGNDQVSHQTRQ